jgi:hypothetical protein
MNPCNCIILNDPKRNGAFYRRPLFKRCEGQLEQSFIWQSRQIAFRDYRLTPVEYRLGNMRGTWIWDCIYVGPPFEVKVETLRGEAVFETDPYVSVPFESRSEFCDRIERMIRDRGFTIVGSRDNFDGDCPVWIVDRIPVWNWPE